MAFNIMNTDSSKEKDFGLNSEPENMDEDSLGDNSIDFQDNEGYSHTEEPSHAQKKPGLTRDIKFKNHSTAKRTISYNKGNPQTRKLHTSSGYSAKARSKGGVSGGSANLDSFMKRNEQYQRQQREKRDKLKLRVAMEEQGKIKDTRMVFQSNSPGVKNPVFSRPRNFKDDYRKRYQSQKTSKEGQNTGSSFFDRLSAPIERKFREREVVKPERNYKKKIYNFNSRKAYWRQIYLPFRNYRHQDRPLNFENFVYFMRKHNFIKHFEYDKEVNTNEANREKELLERAYIILERRGTTYTNLYYFIATMMDATNCEVDKDKTLQESYTYNNEWLFEDLDREQVNWAFVEKADKFKSDFELFRRNWTDWDNIRVRREEAEQEKKRLLESKSRENTKKVGKINYVSEKDKIRAKLYLKDPFFSDSEKEALFKGNEVNLGILREMDKRKSQYESREGQNLKSNGRTEKNPNAGKDYANRLRNESVNSNENQAKKARIVPRGLTDKKIKLDFTREEFDNKGNKWNPGQPSGFSTQNSNSARFGESSFSLSNNKKPAIPSDSVTQENLIGPIKIGILRNGMEETGRGQIKDSEDFMNLISTVNCVLLTTKGSLFLPLRTIILLFTV